MDVTGVFGAVCRHGVPLSILDMKFGERYQYPDIIMKNIERTLIDSDHHQVTLLYDMACKYSAHLRSLDIFEDPSVNQHLRFAIGKMHAYSHGLTCKRKYHPLHVEGCADTDGEAIERFWAYLGLFGLMTRKMLPINRLDQLEDAIRHFTRLKNVNMGKSLCKRQALTN